LSTGSEPHPAEPGRHHGKAWSFFHRRLAGLMRWLHIYVSMFTFVLVLFFSVTGLTLNHPDWTFGTRRQQQKLKGQLQVGWVRAGLAENQVAKLEVAEHLRHTHALRGAVEEFRVDEGECMVSFKGPGASADVFIDRKTGAYQVNAAYEGLVAVLNDLHKGRHTGAAWSLAIDLTAGLMTMISLSGLVLLFYVRRRRVSGLWMAVIGGALGLLVAWLLVP
jgi:hypothetical protein